MFERMESACGGQREAGFAVGAGHYCALLHAIRNAIRV